jgi:hypothetical protein
MYSYVDFYVTDYGLDAVPAISVHDRPVWLVKDEHIDQFALILQYCHALCVKELYNRGGIRDMPDRYVFFSGVDITQSLQWCKDPGMVTPSNPSGFPVYQHESSVLPKNE